METSPKFRSGQGFGQCVLSHLVCWNVFDGQLVSAYGITNKMMFCVDVFRPVVMHRIFCEHSCTIAVAEKGRFGHLLEAKFNE